MKVLDLYLTRLCNLHCEYCYVDLLSEEKTSSYDTITQRINLLEYDQIKFFGGEPLLRFELMQQIIESVKAKKPSINFTVVTNGLLLTDKANDYFFEKGVNIVVSAHKKGITKLVKVIEKLTNKSYLNISLIFEGTDLLFPSKMVKVFSMIGVKNFIFLPEIFSDWSPENLSKMEQELNNIFEYGVKNNLNLGGFDKHNLRKYENNCHKSVYDSEGIYYKCNRFKAIKDKEVDYKEIYRFFEEEISIHTHPWRWFFTCPIGWYLDSSMLEHGEEMIKKRAQQYKGLNLVYIKFFKKIVHYYNIFSFYRDDIAEIRFNIIDQCNIRCNYCYVDFKSVYLDLEKGKEIITFFIEQSGDEKVISFFGGEPLLAIKLVKELVEYAKIYAEKLGKKVSFKIATNFLLIQKDVLDFLIQNSFDIHISWNGMQQYHDQSRDNTYDKLKKNLLTFKDLLSSKNTCILFVVSPEECKNFLKHIEHMASFGFTRFNIEFKLGKGVTFSKEDLRHLGTQLKFIKGKGYIFENLNEKKVYLDISTTGKCADNSLGFHGFDADFNVPYKLNQFVKKILT